MSSQAVEMECKVHGVTTFSVYKSGSPRCRKCGVERVTKWRRETKKRAVEHKGGKCTICGYSKCLQALTFHHKDPDSKEFKISSGNIRSWKKIQVELDKCDLVCLNCHAEIHLGEEE